jgi:poly(3-hydroxybutyrate) depolymerase
MPLVVALSPSGDAAAMISTWKVVADRHGWLVAASKEFRNGIDFKIVLKQLEVGIDSLERAYPVDSTRVVLTGLSGGAMASHAFAQFHAGRVRAVVANTGMMEESFQRDEYPRRIFASSK